MNISGTTPSQVDVSPDRLANNPLLSEQQKIGEASRQFEAILLRQILSATQKTVIQSKFADNSTASGIYRDLFTNQLADTMSKSGAFGLAKTFEHQLTKPAAHSPASSSGPATASGPPHPVLNALPAHGLDPTISQSHSTHRHE